MKLEYSKEGTYETLVCLNRNVASCCYPLAYFPCYFVQLVMDQY